MWGSTAGLRAVTAGLAVISAAVVADGYDHCECSFCLPEEDAGKAHQVHSA